jgi:hypothetical protein
MTADRSATRRLLAMSDDELVASLAELGPSIDYPTVGAGFADRVISRIAAAPAPSAGGGVTDRLRSWLSTGAGATVAGLPLRRALVLAVVLLLVLALAVAALGLGVPGIRIFFAPAASSSPSTAIAAPTPTGSPSATPRPSPTPTSPLIGGRSVSLAEAQAGAGFAVFVPSEPALGQPQRVFLDGSPPFARVTLSYGEGGLLTEFLGEIDQDAFEKVLQPGTTIEALTIEGKPAYWISGEPHELHYNLPYSRDRWETIEVVGNVLVWQRDEVTLRLETPLSKADAVRAAQSGR